MAYLNGNKVFLYGERTVDANLTTKTINKNGTYNASLDNADGYSSVVVDVPDSQGEYFALVVDYDGTILKEQRLNANETFILPDPPSHNGLVFETWSSSEALTQTTVNGKTQYSVTITDNNFMAGPLYHTSSGKHEVDIVVEQGTDLSFTISVLRGGSNVITEVDWGDGNVDSFNSTGLKTHTYESYGKYTLKITLPTGAQYGGYFFDQYNNMFNGNMVKEIRFGNQQQCFSFTYLRQLKAVAKISQYDFTSAYECRSLKCYIPTDASINAVGETFRRCYNLEYAFFNYNNISGFGQYTFLDNYSLKKFVFSKNINIGSSQPNMNNMYSLQEIIIPNTVTNLISNGTMSGCHSLKKIKFIGDAVLNRPSFFYYNDSLEEFKFSDNTTLIPASFFTYCFSLKKVELPNNDVSVGNSAFDSCGSLESLKFKKNVTSIGSSAFSGVMCNIYDFSHCTSVPTLASSNAFSINYSYGNQNAKIFVPSALYNDWIVATNWSTFASKIVPVDNA